MYGTAGAYFSRTNEVSMYEKMPYPVFDSVFSAPEIWHAAEQPADGSDDVIIPTDFIRIASEPSKLRNFGGFGAPFKCNRRGMQTAWARLTPSCLLTTSYIIVPLVH
jgi:hypothetical protein